MVITEQVKEVKFMPFSKANPGELDAALISNYFVITNLGTYKLLALYSLTGHLISFGISSVYKLAYTYLSAAQLKIYRSDTVYLECEKEIKTPTYTLAVGDSILLNTSFMDIINNDGFKSLSEVYYISQEKFYEFKDLFNRETMFNDPLEIAFIAKVNLLTRQVPIVLLKSNTENRYCLIYFPIISNFFEKIETYVKGNYKLIW